MLVSPTQCDSLAYYNEKNESKEQIDGSNFLNKNHYNIKNIFEESVFQNISNWCKNLTPYNRFFYTENLYHNPRNKIYTSIHFDTDHKIIDRNAYLQKGIPSSSIELDQFICILVERFAKELKLVGKHKINVDFYRTRYLEKVTKLKSLQLGWHFDTFAKSTFVAVFQNDFPYEGGKSAGLDIAENKTAGPHHPLNASSCEPKNNYISCPYIRNGALIFHGKKGKIIHRRSIIAKPLLPNATRTVIQIKLKDPNWTEIS